MQLLIFILGACVGSFLNVVSLRYKPERFLLDKKIIGGRSRCPGCGKTLRWFELLPILSFVLQRARCRTCRRRVSWQYPIIEILTGLIFVAVPSRLKFFSVFFSNQDFSFAAVIFTLVFITLVLISLIDWRLSLIPDEANLFLAALGILSIIFTRNNLGGAGGSFLGSYAMLFGLQGNGWVNHFFAAFLGAAVFGFLILITKGRGMGMGDMKLVAALGLIFGWPGAALITGAAFIIGSVFGLGAMTLGKKNMKSAIPFGPFLVAAAFVVFFYGRELLFFYFNSISFIRF